MPDLVPEQIEGANYLASRYRAGLFDDPGFGKTPQAIKALDLHGFDRNIIVCKATARKQWRGEFKKFSTRYRKICVGETLHDFMAWHRGNFDTLITSYEQAAKWAPHVMDACDVIQGLVFDEAQELRNPETLRTRRLLGPDTNGAGGILQWAICAWWMTGSPIWNDPSDIYPFLRGVGVMPLNRKQFCDRYFKSRAGTYSTTHTGRAEMLPELRSLISNNSLRRAFKPGDLPRLLPFGTYLVEGDTQPVRDLLLAHPGLDDMIRDALEDGRSISNLDADHIETLRRLIGEAKSLPYAALLLDELLHNGLDKMVVFGIHRNALQFGHDYLTSHGVGSAMINGSTSSTQDDNNLARFHNDPTLRVMWVNIASGGTSLNMTPACHVDVLESAWTEEANMQAIRRVYRRTQTRDVRVRFITLADSFDETVQEIVARKAMANAQLNTAS